MDNNNDFASRKSISRLDGIERIERSTPSMFNSQNYLSANMLQPTSPINRQFEQTELLKVAGVGVFFSINGGVFTVTSVTEGGSADRSRLIQSRDILKTVDGVSVDGWTLDSVKKSIMGDYGTYVTLGFNREASNGAYQYFETRLIRGTPPWLGLWEKYEYLQKKYDESKDDLLSCRHALASTEAQNAQLQMEVERLSAVSKMLEEQLKEIRGLLNEESRRARLAEGRVENLENTVRLDADELARLRRSVAEYEGELKLAKAVAEEYKEKSEQEAILRKVEAQRKVQAEAREQQAQEQLNAAHESRHNTEMKLEVCERTLADLHDRVKGLTDELNAERERRETAVQRARSAEEDRLQVYSRVETLQTEVTGLESMRKVDAGLIAQLQSDLADQSSRLGSVSNELSNELREHRHTADQLRQCQLHNQADAEEISRLTTKLETSNMEISNLKSTLSTSQKNVVELETREHDLANQVSKYIGDIRRLENSLSSAMCDTSAVRDQLAQTESALQLEKGNLYQANDKIRSLEDNRRQNLEEITRCRQLCEAQTSEIDKLKRDLAESVSQKQFLHGTVSQLEQQNSRNQQEIQRLSELTEKVSSDLSQAKTDFLAENKKVQELEAVTSQLKQNGSRMEQQLNNAIAEKVNVQSLLRDAEHRELEEQSRVRDLSNQLANLRNDLQQMKNQADELNIALSQKLIECDEANRKRFAAEQSQKAAEDQILLLNGTIRKLQQDLAESKAQTDREKDAKTHEASLKEQALNELSLAKKQLDSSTNTVHSLRAETDELKRQLAEEKAALSRKSAEFDRLATQEQKIRKQLEDELAKNVAARVKNDELINRINELEAQLRVNDITRQKLESLYARIRQMEEETARANDAAKEAREELAAFHKLPDPCGVGMQVESDGSSVVIKSLIPDMSAAHSGALQGGDELLAIDNKSVSGMSIGDVRQLITGRRGSYVSFKLRRQNKEFEAKIKRGAYGPDYHIVGSEPEDGPVSGVIGVTPTIPTLRNSVGRK